MQGESSVKCWLPLPFLELKSGKILVFFFSHPEVLWLVFGGEFLNYSIVPESVHMLTQVTALPCMLYLWKH